VIDARHLHLIHKFRPGLGNLAFPFCFIGSRAERDGR
jgi:hypothetical protein